MTRFSARHALSVGALVAVVLAPATWRGVTAPPRSECVVPASQLLEPARFDPWSELVVKGARPSNLEKERLVAIVNDPERPRPLVYSVVRFTMLANALLQPPAALPGMREPDHIESGALTTPDGELPVRYGLEHRGSQIRTTAWFMAYDGEPVESALWTRVRGSIDALLHGPLPINLFVVSTAGHVSDQPRVRARLDRWMRDAWQVYRGVCLGVGAGSPGDPPAGS